MATLPRFRIEMFEAMKDSEEEVSLGLVDLTWAVSGVPVLVKKWLAGEAPRVIDISPGTPDAVRTAGYGGRLSIPGFQAALQEFVAEIGGVERLPELRQAIEKLNRAVNWRDEAAKELKQVAEATWSTDFRQFTMFWSDHASHDGYMSDPEEAFQHWKWDEFEKAHPRPKGRTSDEWSASYQEFVRGDAPPFVFGTRPDKWDMSAASIREQVLDDGEVPNVEDLIESSLEDHHEDAYDLVVDSEGLARSVAAWLPHAGTGDAEDLAFEATVAAWNAKQKVVTYWPDQSVALPAFEGATHQEAIAWCERHLAVLDQKIFDAEDAWAVRQTDMAPAL